MWNMFTIDMKPFKIIVFGVIIFALAACAGNTDINDYDLTISPDKTEVILDGSEIINFAVYYGPENVSKSKDMHITWEKDGVSNELAAGVNTFSVSEVGTYVFSAQFNIGQTTVYSDKTSIVVKESESVVDSKYLRKMLAMEFTSIYCTYCHILAEAVENIQDAYPGRMIPAVFHCDFMGADPMTLPLNSKFYEKVSNVNDESLPLFAFDFRKSSEDIINEYAKIDREMHRQLENYATVCGVAISSTYDASSRKLEVKAGFKTDVSGVYRFHMFLLEDNIQFMQAGHDGSSPYIHNNVVRAISSDNVFGTKLNNGNVLDPGEEYTYTKTFTLDAEWKAENIRVVACMLKADVDGNFHVNNSNECLLNDSVGYLVKE